MTEAESLNADYVVINGFAKEVDRKTLVSKLYNIDTIIAGMGGRINYISAKEQSSSKFLKVLGYNNFEITLLDGLDKQFKRLLLIQALGHYMLHGESGAKICCVSSASQSNTSQEGLWFSLSLLIPDETFLKVHSNFDNKSLSNLFRVPEFAIEAKKKIITKAYFNKEQI